MTYEEKVKLIVDYIKSGEKAESDFKVGFEAEHFTVDKDSLLTASYSEEGGVRDILEELENEGFHGIYENEYIMGLSGDDVSVSIEPAAQFEMAFDARESMDELFDLYKANMKKIIPVFDKADKLLVTVGYQPKSKIDDLNFIPKERYKYMSKYFLAHGGPSPHNMMKGSASLQAAIDYKDEDDFRKKFFVANALSTFLYSTFDNAYIFEGEVYQKHNIRQSIWDNCDPARSGVYDFAFDEDLSYESYAKKILDTDSIFIRENGVDTYTGDTKFEEIFNKDNSLDMIYHALSIVFPDVRVKRYIEVRMPDSVPYPYNLAGVALIKNIFYNEDLLDYLYTDVFADMTYEKSNELKDAAVENGIHTTYKDKAIWQWMLDIIGRIDNDQKYIEPIKELLEKQMTPRDLYEILYQEDPKKALYEFSVNKFVRDINGQD